MKQIKYYTIEEIRQLQKIAYYKPKIKKVCLIIGVILIAICVCTPATNWAIPLIIRGVIYR